MKLLININSLQNISKIIFHFLNAIIIFFYLFPGSIMGFFLYNNIKKQPNLINNFENDIIAISSNHFLTFLILSFFGLFSYLKKNYPNLIIIYLLTMSFFLEIFHIFIPMRTFEYQDLFGNILGVIFMLCMFKVWRKII